MRTSARTNDRVSAIPLGMATLGGNGAPAWEPNWIDYRSSVANVAGRADRGDTAETCRDCGCEIDITPEPHSPKCPTLVRVSVDHGRELLDRMDAGESLTDEPEEAAAVGERAESGAAPLLVGEPERAAASSSSTRSGRGPKWTRESVIAAIQRWAEEHGRPPTQKDWQKTGPYWPAFSTAANWCGGWGAALDAAGFDGKRSRGRAIQKDSGRAEALAPTSPEGNTAGRLAESEREPEATDPAEAEVAPPRRALLAAEGATSRSDVLLRAVALAARAFADAILEEA